jgi:DNA helicase-2/ATP-dependent DNA helicase PcrA
VRISTLAQQLPTCVLGDPLQGIFDLGDGIVSWNHVTNEFPSIGEISEPWRWRSKNTKLGDWCLNLRKALLRGDAIDLEDAPIRRRKVDHSSQRQEAYRLLRSTGRVVVIRKWEQQAHDFARSLGGAYRSMEEVEGKALRAFASALDVHEGPARAAAIVALAIECMTGIKAEIPTLAKALEERRMPTLKQSRKHPLVAKALMDVCGDRSPERVRAALLALESVPGCVQFRRELWGSAKRLVAEHPGSGRARIVETAAAIRQRHRAAGGFIDPRLVSRTLLIKGLEFDHALVPNAEEFESAKKRDGARHFYVAATRASTSLCVLSATPIVQFSVPSL